MRSDGQAFPLLAQSQVLMLVICGHHRRSPRASPSLSASKEMPKAEAAFVPGRWNAAIPL